MTTREDLETELLAQLQAASNSTMYPSTRITTLIKNAYMWATQLAIWHDLVRGKQTVTKASGEYYDYPEELRSETIIRLEVDGTEYNRYNFEDYLDYKKRNTNTTKKMFASFGRQFFINPTPTVADLVISVWGAIQADPLDDATDEPIFSKNKEEANEAVVKKAFSVAIKRTDPALAVSEEQSATLTLLKLASDEQKSTQRNQRLDHPMFNVPDYLMGTGATPYRRFNYDREEL